QLVRHGAHLHHQDQLVDSDVLPARQFLANGDGIADQACELRSGRVARRARRLEIGLFEEVARYVEMTLRPGAREAVTGHALDEEAGAAEAVLASLAIVAQTERGRRAREPVVHRPS